MIKKNPFIPVRHEGKWQVLDAVAKVYYSAAAGTWESARNWCHELNKEI
jgi:hypothetical protein